MSGYKEFEGKTLDEAIRDACSFYDATREKLEIEIVNDAKGGIFGLVGARKAKIKARLVDFGNVLDALDAPAKDRQPKKRPESSGNETHARSKNVGEEEGASKKQPRDVRKISPRPAAKAEQKTEQAENVAAAALVESAAKPAPKLAPKGGARQDGRSKRPKQEPSKAHENGGGHPVKSAEGENGLHDVDMDVDDLHRVPFDQLDVVELEKVTREVVSRLTFPILGEASINVVIADDRVRVGIADVEDPGLLIGRDGQTLASLQYLAARMVSNRMKALLRVQIDAGDYRERQDERLRDLALTLAEKVKSGGRPQVTRPLSSYQRRVIHLALQDDPLIQTHSKGEGEMKRVMVARRKSERNA